jgi:hypothetical protein
MALIHLVGVVVLGACQTGGGASTTYEPPGPGSVPEDSAASREERTTSEDAEEFRPTPSDPADVDVIESDVDVASHTVDDAEGIPESSAWEPSGNFRFVCEFSHLSYDDPIVYPGQPGAAHLHMFFGNVEADASSTYATLRANGDSTCQGGPLNRSGYWAPAVFNAAGDVVRPEYITVYYKGPGSAPDGSIIDVQPLPPGLRMIAGQDIDAPSTDSAHEWYCEVEQAASVRIPNCGPDELVGVSLAFPSCWNGAALDSADHRSHMAYEVRDPESGIASCPSSHPVPLPEFTLGIWFEHDGDSSNWYLSSDRHGDAVWDNGASFHSDWYGAWDPAVQQTWIDECINGLLNCVGGQLGDGTKLEGVAERAGPAVLETPEP